MNKSPAIDFGKFLIWAGIICWCYFFFSFDTSVSVPSEYYPGVGQIGGGRVNNLGLMQDRELGCVAGIAMFGIGLLLVMTAPAGIPAKNDLPPENPGKDETAPKQPISWSSKLLGSVIMTLFWIGIAYSPLADIPFFGNSTLISGTRGLTKAMLSLVGLSHPSKDAASPPQTSEQEALHSQEDLDDSKTPVPESKAERVARAQSLIEHEFDAIHQGDYSAAAQDNDDLTTLLSETRPDLESQGAEVSTALRQLETTHSDGDAQNVLALIQAYAAALNSPRPPKTTDLATPQERAVALYPALAVANSPLNREFLARYRRYQADNPLYFTNPDWPTALAKESADAIYHH